MTLIGCSVGLSGAVQFLFVKRWLYREAQGEGTLSLLTGKLIFFFSRIFAVAFMRRQRYQLGMNKSHILMNGWWWVR
ncbi:hypothetical protein [Paenochrobactrum pullorum]|uniref:hypothetical protein n=1 Tax=Paenochrobactrum pullorum TaxID=1324351 RepID=UPI0035BBEA66